MLFQLYGETAGYQLLGFVLVFKVFPFAIVAINILIAVASDFESGIRGAKAMMEFGDRWWLSSENVWLYGGWWNWVNGIAGIINIFCMTAWWGIYNCLPTHSWYCGLALLLAPTFANHFWNKGGWIQNRANTLALWCMFAQVFPLFQDNSVFTTITSVYADGFMNPAVRPTAANPTAQGVVAIIALVVNVVILASIIKRAKAQKKNPYKQEIFCDQKDFQEAMARV